MFRFRATFRLWIGLSGTVALFASDPAWKTKPITEWDRDDAREVLASSPWVKPTVPGLIPELTAEQRRAGGVAGGGHGVGLKGLAGVDLFGRGGTANHRSNKPATAEPVVVRWESALPVRAAELKAGELGSPDWEGDLYVLAVYGVPDVIAGGKLKMSAATLRKAAALKCEGNADLRPAEARVLEEPDALATVIYLFPRAPHLAQDDLKIEFVAQIGRLAVAQFFYTGQMALAGKLQL